MIATTSLSVTNQSISHLNISQVQPYRNAASSVKRNLPQRPPLLK